jgi:hypothetical protein
MPSATLNGNACASAYLTIPGVGLWYAECDLADAVALSGAVTLAMLDTAWSGTIIAGATVDGRARYRVVAGAGRWGAELPARAYANDAGLQVSRLIADAASEVGEPAPIGAPVDRKGPHYDRPRNPASFCLNILAPRAWYAGADGVVRFGARPALPATGLVTVDRNPAARSVTYAAVDSFAGLLPRLQTEYGTAADVELSVGPEGARARAYAALEGGNARAQLWAAMLDAIDPGRAFRGVFEYRIVTQSGERLNLQPVRSRANLPDLARVPVRAGVPGVRATHKPGAQVLVAFIDGDPTRPAVVGFDAPDQPGWMPIVLELGGPVPLAAARQTDPVIAGPFSGTIVGGSSRVKVVS